MEEGIVKTTREEVLEICRVHGWNIAKVKMFKNAVDAGCFRKGEGYGFAEMEDGEFAGRSLFFHATGFTAPVIVGALTPRVRINAEKTYITSLDYDEKIIAIKIKGGKKAITSWLLLEDLIRKINKIRQTLPPFYRIFGKRVKNTLHRS